MSAPATPIPGKLASLRSWLEYVAQSAIDWLDELDAAEADREPEDAA